MKNIIYLILFSLIFTDAAYSLELQGGVKFDVKSAREYLQEGEPDNVDVSGPLHFIKSDPTGNVVYSYDNGGNIIGITVQCKNDPTKSYIYDKNYNLKYINQYDKPTTIYPHRGYRYDLNGKLVLSSLVVSKYEQFRFDMDGNLIAHSIKNIIYDENGNAIGKFK